MSTAYRTATAASHLLQPWPSQTSLDTIQCQLQPLIRQHQPLLCKTCNTNQAQFIIQNQFNIQNSNIAKTLKFKRNTEE